MRAVEPGAAFGCARAAGAAEAAKTAEAAGAAGAAAAAGAAGASCFGEATRRASDFHDVGTKAVPNGISFWPLRDGSEGPGDIEWP